MASPEPCVGCKTCTDLHNTAQLDAASMAWLDLLCMVLLAVAEVLLPVARLPPSRQAARSACCTWWHLQ